MPTPTGSKASTDLSATDDAGAARNILDRPLPNGAQQVSLSALSFLFAETIQYFQERIENVRELERLLVELGHSAGSRMLDLMVLRKRPGQRDLKIVTALQFVSTVSHCILVHDDTILQATALCITYPPALLAIN
jgi:hypothetical protein